MYDEALDHPEEAVAFYRQAADQDVEIGDTASEGRDRYNLTTTLWKLRRMDKAPQEIQRAIVCDSQFGHASEPWKTWAILANIEMDANNPDAAADASRTALACYLAYRRDGGENHNPEGRIALAVTQSLLDDDPATAASLLEQLAAEPDAAWLLPFIRALQAIVAGSRDRTLADAPDLDYSVAAEILILIETLENPRSPPTDHSPYCPVNLKIGGWAMNRTVMQTVPRGIHPGGTSDSSPAIHRWVTSPTSASSRLRFGVAVSERQGDSRRWRSEPAATALPLTTPILSLDDALGQNSFRARGSCPPETDGKADAGRRVRRLLWTVPKKLQHSKHLP